MQHWSVMAMYLAKGYSTRSAWTVQYMTNMYIPYNTCSYKGWMVENIDEFD